QQPSKRRLARCDSDLPRDRPQDRVGSGERSCGEREERDEGNPLALAPFERRLLAAIDQVISLLDGRDPEVLRRDVELIGRRVAQPDVTDQTLALQVCDHTELIVERYGLVDAMQLPEIDSLDPEQLQAACDVRS
ncbi:MAG TPA: hypothetical protein VFQ65_18575, partial [Kofleriaceae bacterium]|nr:hypothetical protein [Kofleriaceae bacterium]